MATATMTTVPMTGAAILAPAAVLVAWTCVIWLWMLAVRMPALRAAGVDLGKLTGGTGADAARVVPPQAQWKANNYNHLLEQPTAYYAVVLILAVTGGATQVTVALAWAYAVLRIAHSLWQVLVNKVLLRFWLFVASTLCLAALAVATLFVTLG